MLIHVRLLLLAGCFYRGLAVGSASFDEFAKQYNKSYESAAEEERRRNVFNDRVAKIEAHNRKFDRGEVTFKMGVTRFADFTDEELAGYNRRSSSTKSSKAESDAEASTTRCEPPALLRTVHAHADCGPVAPAREASTTDPQSTSSATAGSSTVADSSGSSETSLLATESSTIGTSWSSSVTPTAPLSAPASPSSAETTSTPTTRTVTASSSAEIDSTTTSTDAESSSTTTSWSTTSTKAALSPTISDSSSSATSPPITTSDTASTTDAETTLLATTTTTKTTSQRQHSTTKPSTLSACELPNGYPCSVDWRQTGIIVPVRDQGDCASCWAFATADTISAYMHTKGDGPLLTLSAQNLVDCANEIGKNPVFNMSNDDGCDGGSPIPVFYYVEWWAGIETEESYPYAGVYGGHCNYNSAFNAAPYTWRDYDKLPFGYFNAADQEETVLLPFVATTGPVVASIYAACQSMFYYVSGVNRRNIANSGVFYDPSCNLTPDHIVMVIGHGTDATTGLPYWLIKNSWGTNWGEEGYMRMRRDVGQSSITEWSFFYPLL